MTEESSEKTRLSEVSEQEEKTRQIVEDLLQGVDRTRSNLIPILQLVQKKFGYLPREAMLQVADFLGIPDIDVYSVVTFYNQFRLNPPGEHSITVCLGTACHVKGGKMILEAWERRLGIMKGQTTLDREFDLDTVACVGCCAMAPVTIFDNKVIAKISPTRVDGILLSHQIEKAKREKGDQ